MPPRRTSRGSSCMFVVFVAIFGVGLPISVLTALSGTPRPSVSRCSWPRWAAARPTWCAASVSLISSRLERARQAQLYDVQSREIARYHVLRPSEFEHAIAYLCQRDGCTDVVVSGGAGDLGADVTATAPDGRMDRHPVQAVRAHQ